MMWVEFLVDVRAQPKKRFCDPSQTYLELILTSALVDSDLDIPQLMLSAQRHGL